MEETFKVAHGIETFKATSRIVIVILKNRIETY